jgi:hypothetical protein
MKFSDGSQGVVEFEKLVLVFRKSGAEPGMKTTSSANKVWSVGPHTATLGATPMRPSSRFKRISEEGPFVFTNDRSGAGSKPRVMGASRSKWICHPGNMLNSFRPFIVTNA